MKNIEKGLRGAMNLLVFSHVIDRHFDSSKNYLLRSAGLEWKERKWMREQFILNGFPLFWAELQVRNSILYP